MTNSEWVTLLYFFARQSHQSCLIPWPTVCEWHCFISLPGSLINRVSSHDQQSVSDSTLFLCQSVSSIISHPMTNSEWVTLPFLFQLLHDPITCWTGCKSYEFFSQPVSLPLILWPTVCEGHPIFASHFSSYDKQFVSGNAWNLYLIISSYCMYRKCVIPLHSNHITFYCMSNRKWVELNSKVVHQTPSYGQ